MTSDIQQSLFKVPYSQYNLATITPLFQKDPSLTPTALSCEARNSLELALRFSPVDQHIELSDSMCPIYNIYNQTKHQLSINHSDDNPQCPHQIYIDEEETNVYLDLHPGQNIYLINYEQSLFFCCEDGSDKQYFELKRHQKGQQKFIKDSQDTDTPLSVIFDPTLKNSDDDLAKSQRALKPGDFWYMSTPHMLDIIEAEAEYKKLHYWAPYQLVGTDQLIGSYRERQPI